MTSHTLSRARRIVIRTMCGIFLFLTPMSESASGTLDDVRAIDGPVKMGDADDDTVVLFEELNADEQNRLIMKSINKGARSITEAEVREHRASYRNIMGRDVTISLEHAATEIATWRTYSEESFPDDLDD